jgi:translocation and assembly module TamB
MRRILKILAICLFVAAALLTAGVAFVHTAPGENFITRLAKSSLDGPGTTVGISGLEIAWGGNVRVGRISVADKNGQWLEIEKVDVDWRPLALLRRQLQIDLFAIGAVTLHRQPEETDAAPEEESTAALPGALPIGIDIAEFDIAEINLGKEITRDPVRLISSGSFRVRPNPLVLEGSLEVERDDDIHGRIDAGFAFQPDTRIARFDLSAREPRGGVIARLMEIDALPAIDLSLQGDGPIDNWRASLAVALDDVPTASGHLTIDRARGNADAEARQLRFDLDGEIGRLMPQALRPLFAGTTASSGELLLDDTFKPVQGKLEATTGAVTVNAAGLFTADRLSADLDARLLAPIALRFADRQIAAEALRISAHASGTPDNAILNATMDGREITTTEGAFTDLTASLTSRDANLAEGRLNVPVRFDISGTVGHSTDPRFQPLAGQSRISGNVVLRTDRQLDVRSLSLTAPGLQAGIKGSVSPENASLDGTVSASDLSKFAGLAGDKLGGASEISFSAAAAPQTRSGKIEFTGSGKDLSFGIDPLDALVAGETRLSGALDLAADGALTARSLKVTTRSLDMDLDGTTDFKSIDARLAAKVANLDLVHADLAGELDFSATATGPFAAPKVLAELKSSQLVMYGEPVEALELSGDLTASPTAPGGAVRLEATLRGQPVTGSATLSTDHLGVRRIDGLSFAAGASRLTGNLALGMDNIPSGALDFTSPDLAEIAPLLLLDLSGALDVNVDISAPDGQAVAQVTAAAHDIASNDNRIGSANLTATVSGLDTAPHVDGRLVAGDISVGSATVETLAIDAAGTAAGTDFSGKATLPEGGLEVAGRISQVPSGISVVLDQGNGHYKKLETRLSAPAEVILREGGGTDIGTISLALGGGRATIAGTAGETIDLTIGLEAVPAALANAVSPDLGLGGLLSGTLSVTGSGTAPSADWSVQWQGAQLARLSGLGLPPANIGSKGRFDGKTVTHQSQATLGDGGKLTASGTVTLGDGPRLDMAVSGTLPFRLAQRQLTESGLRLDGSASVDMRIGGSANAPAISGQVSTRGATVVSLSTGLVVKDVNATADISTDQVRIANLSGQIGNGGTISGSGTIGLTGSIPADLTLTIRDGIYTDGRIVTAKIDGDLTLTGPLADTPEARGIITIKRADITIPQALPGSLAPVDVTHVNAPSNVARQTALMTKGSRKSSSGAVALALTISAPGQIFVRGRGLQAELGGQIGITGTSSAPVATGAFTLKYGTLSVLSRLLTFTKGTITFLGSFDPVLDFAATTSANSTAITVAVAGNATDPKIEFSSTPSYPQEEILALLLFNQNLSNLSAAQVAQLASAVASLGGADPLDKLRKALGVDSVNIVTDDDNQTSVELRKRVGDNISLGVQQGAQQGSSRVTVDIDVTKNLRARGETDSSGSSKAGIFFEKEF